MRFRSFVPVALVVTLALALAGCAPGVDRDSLNSRDAALVAEVLDISDVLEATVGVQQVGTNSVQLTVRIDDEAGEARITDAMVAVRDAMSASDFELYHLEVLIHHVQERTWAATIQWSGLPYEELMREEAGVWFDLIEAEPVDTLDYTVIHEDEAERLGYDVTVGVLLKSPPDGVEVDEGELREAFDSAWAAAGRDPDKLVVAVNRTSDFDN
jgi:hypothetical protein